MERLRSGEEAVRLGFALEATPAGAVMERARELAASYATAPTLALSQIKRQFDAAPNQTLNDAL